MKALRALLPGIKDLNYFNYAAIGPLLLPASEYLKKAADDALAPFIHRETWLKRQEETRQICADLIGAEKEEIAFVNNTSHGLSIVANAIRWKKGDRILFPADEYPANRFVWENLREKGVLAEPVKVDPKLPFAEQLKKMDLKGVRLIAISATSYYDGRRHDIERISRICKSEGILLSVDVIQAVGATEVNVKKWDCDFLATGGRKWLFGPLGTGFLYVRKRLLEELFVPLVGLMSTKNRKDLETVNWEFSDNADRFESSLLYVPAINALGTAIETLKGFGWEKIFARIGMLHGMCNRELLGLGYNLLRPDEASGICVVTFPDEGKASHLALKCAEKKVLVTQRKKLVRIAVHAATEEKEIETLLEVFAANR